MPDVLTIGGEVGVGVGVAIGVAVVAGVGVATGVAVGTGVGVVLGVGVGAPLTMAKLRAAPSDEVWKRQSLAMTIKRTPL